MRYTGIAVALALGATTTACVNMRPTPPADDPSTQLLTRAAEQSAEGDYSSAAATYRELAGLDDASPYAAQALFQLAALQWNPASPAYDPGEAIATLRHLAAEYPDSPWAPAAETILTLAHDKTTLERAVAALRLQLEQLKQLDLQPNG